MSEDLRGVFAALDAQPTRGDAGRTLMFVPVTHAADATQAAQAAAFAAPQTPVFGIDLDLRHNALAQGFAKHHGLGVKMDGVLGGLSFCSAVGRDGRTVEGSERRFSYHRVGQSSVFVGAYDGRVLPLGAQLELSFAGDYWSAACASGGTVVIAAPALSTNSVALRVAPHMHGVVLVVSGETGAAPAARAAKAALTKAGARVIGLIYADASAPVMALDRMLRQAG